MVRNPMASTKTERIERGSVVGRSKSSQPRLPGPSLEDLSMQQRRILADHLGLKGHSLADYSLKDSAEGLVFSNGQPRDEFVLRTQDRFGRRFADPSACPGLSGRGYSSVASLDEGMTIFGYKSGDGN